MTKPKIIVNSQRAGSGKSEAMRNSIKASSDNHNVVTPTVALNSEYARVCKQVDSSTHRGDVEDAVDHHVSADGNVVVTQKSFKATHSSERVLGKHLVIDEAFQDSIKSFTCIFYPAQDRSILDWFEVESFHHDSLKIEIKEKHREAVRELLDDRDYVKGRPAMAGWLGYLSDHNYFTVTSKEEWQRFQKSIADADKQATITSIAILKAEVVTQHKSTTLLAADAHKEEFAIAMKWQDVELEDISVTRSMESPNSDLVTIHYFSEENWSKGLRVAKNSYGLTNYLNMARHINGALAGRPFIWNSNKDNRDELAEVFGQEPLIEVHGVNSYRHCTVAAFLPSRNLDPLACRVANQIGLNADEINFARNQLAAYQFCMRTAIREEHNRKPVDLYVTDKETARYLKACLPEATLKYEEILLSFQEATERPPGIRQNTWNKYLQVEELKKDGLTQNKALAQAGLSKGSLHKVKKALKTWDTTLRAA